MTCNNCGNQVKAGNLFCGDCGAKLAANKPARKGKLKTLKMISLVLLFCLVLVAGGLAAFATGLLPVDEPIQQQTGTTIFVQVSEDRQGDVQNMQTEQFEIVAEEPVRQAAAVPWGTVIPEYITLRGEQYSTSLTQLDLGGWTPGLGTSGLAPANNLTDAEISSLRYMINLTELILHNTGISDLTSLANLTNLERLGLGHNQISDLTPLANLTNLEALGLDDNQISDLRPLANLTNLDRLWLRYNQISDLTPLANLTNLTQLGIQYNQISDLTPLANLTNLRSVFSVGNPIAN